MRLFKVIVELFECEWSDKHKRNFLNEAKADHKILIDLLKKTTGIYSFYNSELEIIYVGKTKFDLWTEMKNAYNRQMPKYKRYVVSHPHEKYAHTKSGLARKIVSQSLAVWQTASYFSAYAVNEEYIDELESFIIRLMPNDVANVKMEGNASIEMHVEEAKN